MIRKGNREKWSRIFRNAGKGLFFGWPVGGKCIEDTLFHIDQFCKLTNQMLSAENCEWLADIVLQGNDRGIDSVHSSDHFCPFLERSSSLSEVLQLVQYPSSL